MVRIKQKPSRVAIAALAEEADFARIVAACEARVVERQWASGDIWSPEPLWFERNQLAPGRKLAKQPAPKIKALQYCYDATGAVARIRTWSGDFRRWHEEELFLPRRDGVLIAYRYCVDGTLMGVRRLTHDAKGRLVLQELYAAARKVAWSLRYVWRDGLLARVNRPKRGGHSWALEWDARGRLAKIAQLSDGKTYEIYRRPADGETLEGLLAIVRERLLAVIPALAAKVKPKSAAYALAIVVMEEWRHMLPPTLAIGFEEDRARLRASHPECLRDVLWTAAELPTFDVSQLELRDRRLGAASTRANQHLWMTGKQRKTTLFLRGVAAELQALDWSLLRRVSDDFVVYVTTAEGDGYRDVRRDAPPALRKRLIDRREL